MKRVREKIFKFARTHLPGHAVPQKIVLIKKCHTHKVIRLIIKNLKKKYREEF